MLVYLCKGSHIECSYSLCQNDGKFQTHNPFPTDNFKKYTKKTNPKITILECLVYKIQPEITKSKIFTHFNFITKPCSKE